MIKPVNDSGVNRLYENLAFEQDFDTSGYFLSGWQSENPFALDFCRRVQERTNMLDATRYYYFDEDEGLISEIRQFHKGCDSNSPEEILCGAGSTALLTTFAAHLCDLGIDVAYYVPPIYHTIPPILGRFGIKSLSLSELHPVEAEFCIQLPEGRSVLFMSDPIWYAGRRLPWNVVEAIKQWQQRTESIVFVDGSLQYLSWEKSAQELSSSFDPALTFRLICPSKQLSINGYRFAYMLLPKEHYRKAAWTYANLIGAASISSVAFGHEALSEIRGGKLKSMVIDLARNRFVELIERKILSTPFFPNSGYFVFGEVFSSLPEFEKVVDGRFFDQPRWPHCYKINLLSKSIQMLID